MKRNAIFLLLLMTLSYSCVAQFYSSRNSKAIAFYEKGVDALQRAETANALKLFSQALKADPAFGEVHLALGDHYLKVEDYATARSHYEAFLHSKCSNSVWRNDAQRGIATIDFRLHALAHPLPFEPQNLGSGVNTAYDEYLPSVTVDGQTMVFTRRFPRTSSSAAGVREEEDLYISHYMDGLWSKAERMAEPLNSNDNEGAQCMSQDGRIIFFTANGRDDCRGRCDIYMCTNKGGVWSKPRNLGSPINTPAWESQPSFAIDGKTLYFVSDRPGGCGGKDIWKSVFENGRWSTPQNLGPTVNTPYDEMSPYICFNNKKLYFASNGHIGMGGMDIFCSFITDTGWSRPVNMGYPINTSGDESGFVFLADGTGLYSSEREGGFGRQDLYSFRLPNHEQLMASRDALDDRDLGAILPPTVWYIKGYVYDRQTNHRLKSNIQLIEVNTGEEVAVVGSDLKDGTYMVSLPAGGDYAFHVSAEGYLFYSENFDLGFGLQPDDSGHIEHHHFIQNIALSPIAVGESMVLENVFFAVGKAELVASDVELDKVVDLMTKNPTLKVELAGHTDNVGRPADNQKLSEERAKVVYNYLVAHGIDAHRLAYKGYGETQPVADNSTEEGRAKNRRTTFTIIEK